MGTLGRILGPRELYTPLIADDNVEGPEIKGDVYQDGCHEMISHGLVISRGRRLMMLHPT